MASGTVAVSLVGATGQGVADYTPPPSVAQQISNALVTQIQSIGLTGLSSTEIVARKFAWNSGGFYRGISVVPLPEKVRALYPNECDDIGYQFGIFFVTGSNPQFGDTLANVREWRQKVRRKFINQRLTGVSSVYICRVTHEELYAPREYTRGHEVGTLVVTCWAREERT